MIETSQDVLYLVLAASVGLFTIFLIWLIAEISIMLRRMNHFIGDLHRTISKIEETLSGIREKIEHSTGYFHLLVDGVVQLLKFFAEQKVKPSKTKIKNKE